MSSFPLYLLRHGAPETPGLLLGRTDSPVTAAGIDACTAQIADLEIEALHCSDLLRARACAEACGAPRDSLRLSTRAGANSISANGTDARQARSIPPC